MTAGAYIHPTAVVDEGARIGEGTRVWHFTHIMPTAVIGKNCTIGQNVFIGARVRIGDYVKIQNNVSVYEGVRIEDEVFIGPSVVFTNVKRPRSLIERKSAFVETVVRKGASLGANATVVCGIEVGMYAMVGAGSVLTKDVADHALVVGNPAGVVGWVDEAGEELRFDERGTARSKDNSITYVLIQGSRVEIQRLTGSARPSAINPSQP